MLLLLKSKSMLLPSNFFYTFFLFYIIEMDDEVSFH